MANRDKLLRERRTLELRQSEIDIIDSALRELAPYDSAGDSEAEMMIANMLYFKLLFGDITAEEKCIMLAAAFHSASKGKAAAAEVLASLYSSGEILKKDIAQEYFWAKEANRIDPNSSISRIDGFRALPRSEFEALSAQWLEWRPKVAAELGLKNTQCETTD